MQFFIKNVYQATFQIWKKLADLDIHFVSYICKIVITGMHFWQKYIWRHFCWRHFWNYHAASKCRIGASTGGLFSKSAAKECVSRGHYLFTLEGIRFYDPWRTRTTQRWEWNTRTNGIWNIFVDKFMGCFRFFRGKIYPKQNRWHKFLISNFQNFFSWLMLFTNAICTKIEKKKSQNCVLRIEDYLFMFFVTH